MTSNFIRGPGEVFIQCPYNTAHQITNARLLTHLEKCRRSYLKTLSEEGRRRDMKICRFNYRHHCPSPEIAFHEERCQDALSVIRHMAYHNSEEGNRSYDERRHMEQARIHSHESSSASSSKSSGKHETKPVVFGNQYGLEEEDWEADSAGYQPGYDPQQKLKSEVVIYNPAGLSKSERKKFRTEVRVRAAEMSLTGEVTELPTASSFDLKPDLEELELKNVRHEEREDRHHPSSNSFDYGGSSQCSSSRNESSRDDSYYHADKSKSTKASSSNSWYKKQKDEFSEDDFEGDDPFA